jgi:hypothetical protein
MMRLQSKKVGIMLEIKQLGDTRILNEINRIMFEGAEVLIVLMGGKKEQEAKSFPALFHESLFDLLVFIPCTGRQLSLLKKAIPRDYSGLPLVIAPVLERDSRPPFEDISILLEIRGIYFIPFGPLPRKNEEKRKEQIPALFSRLDLLTESCIAALEGHSLRHSFWENNFFP